MRPWSVVGHAWAVQQLRHAVAQDGVPHALLITGPPSVGKHTLARQLIAAVLCQSEENRPCADCLSCRKLRSGNHPDFLEVGSDGATSHLKIDEIRQVERFLVLTPKETSHKIVLIEGFERATIGAANALLKTLEEPPSYAHLILLATDADLLMPTIVSRTQQLVLRPLSAQVVEEALVSVWQVEPGLAQRLARLSGGRIGWAVRAATDPETYERMVSAVGQLLEILGMDLPSRFAAAKALARDSDAVPETLDIWLTLWRDVLLLQSRSDTGLTHTEQRETLMHIAEATTLEQSVEVLGGLRDARSALLSNANVQLLVETLLLEMPPVVVV